MYCAFDPLSYREHERGLNMSNSGIIGAYVGIFVLIGSMLGSLEHASKADPSFVHQAHVAVHGVVIPPFRD